MLGEFVRAMDHCRLDDGGHGHVLLERALYQMVSIANGNLHGVYSPAIDVADYLDPDWTL